VWSGDIWGESDRGGDSRAALCKRKLARKLYRSLLRIGRVHDMAVEPSPLTQWSAYRSLYSKRGLWPVLDWRRKSRWWGPNVDWWQ
jgi:hypothetical protein